MLEAHLLRDGGSAGGSPMPIHAWDLFFFFVVTTPSAKSAKDCYMTETAHVAGEEQKSLVSVGSSSVGEKGKV